MQRRRSAETAVLLALTLGALTLGACAKKQPPVARPVPPPPPPAPAEPAPPPPPEPVVERTPIPPEPVLEEQPVDSRSLDELNRDSPLVPIFFAYDSAEVTAESQTELARNADLLRQNASWVITIEGHCDERGTAEYNIALGERRALAAREYLTTLGISAERLRTVSYGKEFPFDPGHDEAAWARNRRAHFVITAK